MRDANGTITTFDVPGSKSTIPRLISEDGTISGSYTQGDHHEYAFTRTPDGIVTTFSDPSANSTIPKSTNNKGVIVGNSAKDHAWGFMRTADGIASFDIPGAIHSVPLGINSDGIVVGEYMNDGSTMFSGFIFYSKNDLRTITN